jgi:hypothetical protein
VPKRLDFNKPIAIMTHKGVISLQPNSRGVDSKLDDLGQNRSSEDSLVDSIDTRSVSFTSNAVGPTTELDVVVSTMPERGTKTKKIKKHPIVHHHGSRFMNFQSYIQKKGALLKKKKAARREMKNAKVIAPVESDPIQSSARRVEGMRTDENTEGFSLEVVLPFQHVINDSSCLNGPNQMVVAGGVDGEAERGHENLGRSNNCSSPDGGEEDRRRSQAHHIIDILEDVGMNFNGDIEANVNRIMECEERDKRDLVVWEQGQDYQ